MNVNKADESAKFTVPGANTIGLYCHSPAVQVTRAVPDKVSYYMLSTGRMINAEEALQAGLVSRSGFGSSWRTRYTVPPFANVLGEL